MADEQENSRMDGDRPVQPPTIDVEAEEIVRGEESAPGEPPAETPEAPEQKPWARVSVSVVLAVLALLLASGSILAVAGLINLRPPGEEKTVEPRLAELDAASRDMGQRISELTAAISRFEEKVQQGAASGPAPDSGIGELVQKLEAQVGSFGEALGRIGATLKSIEDRQVAQQEDAKDAANVLGELSSRVNASPMIADQAAPDGSAQIASKELAGALVRLRKAAREGRGFAEELQRLNSLLPEAVNQDLTQVSVHGAVSFGELSNRLRAIVNELRAPDSTQAFTPGPAGVWESFKSKAASLVSVRRIEDAQSLDVAERGLQLLEQGDLRGAVQLLSSNRDQKPASIEAWLRDAEARLKVDRASEDLTNRVLEQLGGGS